MAQSAGWLSRTLLTAERDESSVTVARRLRRRAAAKVRSRGYACRGLTLSIRRPGCNSQRLHFFRPEGEKSALSDRGQRPRESKGFHCAPLSCPSQQGKYNVTQTELAQKIRAKQKSISRYENGASVPTIDTLIKIANALKKPLAHFVAESD